MFQLQPWKARMPMAWGRNRIVVALGVLGYIAAGSDFTVGEYHMCATGYNGSGNNVMKCWGWNELGQLGLQSWEAAYPKEEQNSINEYLNRMGDKLPAINLGHSLGSARHIATQIQASDSHTCALLQEGTVKCWGKGTFGRLGLDTMISGEIGQDVNQMGDNLPTVNFGDVSTSGVNSIATGLEHNCALLRDGGLKCWGRGFDGRLGQGSSTNIGGGAPQPLLHQLPPIDFGSRTSQIKRVEAGSKHTCVLFYDNSLTCFGVNNYGQLGTEQAADVGLLVSDMGDNLLEVDLGYQKHATQIALGGFHSCALLNDNTLKCWGNGNAGRLGLGRSITYIGKVGSEMGDSLDAVDLGQNLHAVGIAAGSAHTCALLQDRSIKCWGNGLYGQLGRENINNYGGQANHMGDNLPIVDLGVGKFAKRVIAGAWNTCAILLDESVKCWGKGNYGQNGQNKFEDIGDGSGEMGDNLPPIDLGFTTSTSTTLEQIGWEQSSTMEQPSTSASPTTSETSTLTTTGAAVTLQGTMNVKITDAAAFLQDPNALEAVKHAIADICEVDISWVDNVVLTIESNADLPGGRLLSLDIKDTLVGNDVLIVFDVIIPPDETDPWVVATVISDKFDRKTVIEATEAMNQALERAMLDQEYKVTVEYKRVKIVDKAAPPPSPAPSDDGFNTVTMILVVCISFISICLMVLTVWCFPQLRQRRRKTVSIIQTEDAFLKVAGPLGAAGVHELLSPPPSISKERKEELHRLLSAMMCKLDEAEVDLFISYAHGHRSEDTAEVGPGLFFAAALLKALYVQGLNCILVVPGVVDTSQFLTLLRAQASRKLMLVLETSALFNSRQCLEEIFVAKANSFELKRIRFEGVPDVANIWPLIKDTDTDGVQMFKAVESAYFVLPTYPDPPLTVLKDSAKLESLALDLKLQKDLHSSNFAGSSLHSNLEFSPSGLSCHSAVFFSELVERTQRDSGEIPLAHARTLQEMPIVRSVTLQRLSKSEEKQQLLMARAETLQDLPSADKKKKNSDSSGDSLSRKKGRSSSSQDKKTSSNVIGKSKGADVADRRRLRPFRESPKEKSGDDCDPPAFTKRDSKKKPHRSRADRSSSRHKHSPSPLQPQRSTVRI